MELLSVVAIGLLIAGIVGTVVPLVPGGLLSASGLLLYWWQSGFAEPGPIAMAILTSLALLTLIVEFFGGSLAAKAGGASWQTTGVAAVVGIALMVVAGPLGLLGGIFGTVFILEVVDTKNFEGSARSATYATVGILASTAMQVVLTTAIFLGFLIAIIVF